MKLDVSLRRQKRRNLWVPLLNNYMAMYYKELLLPTALKIEVTEGLKKLIELAKRDALIIRHLDQRELDGTDLDLFPETKKQYEIYTDFKALKSKLVQEEKYEESANVRDKERKQQELLFKTAFEAFYGQVNFVVRKENELLFHPQYGLF